MVVRTLLQFCRTKFWGASESRFWSLSESQHGQTLPDPFLLLFTAPEAIVASGSNSSSQSYSHRSHSRPNYSHVMKITLGTFGMTIMLRFSILTSLI